MIEIRRARAGDFFGIVRGEVELQSCNAYFNASTFAWTGLMGDRIASIWGLIPPTILSDSAYLWLLTTPVVDEHKFLFVRHSQLILDRMLEDFPIIVGHVISDQARSKKWLKWLGVTFKPAVDAGNTRVVPFELRRAIRG